MTLYNSSAEMIGKTPLLRMNNLEKALDVRAHIYAKIESANPAGSVKDRVALYMIQDAERTGLLKPGGTIIEPTSGNTGVGLAALAAAWGYKLIIVMPDSMSIERRKLIQAYGAELVLTPGAEGMSGAIAKATELHHALQNSIIAGQFVNPANPYAHEETTGPEIWDDLDGNIDAFVAGVGTGGTVSGVGSFLRNKKHDIHIVAVEPASSPVLSQGVAGVHGIQGIGAGFIPDTLQQDAYDEIIAVEDAHAFEYARMVPQTEGILVGISAGAALCAAVELAKRDDFEGKSIVVLFPDSGERYLSTRLFEGE